MSQARGEGSLWGLSSGRSCEANIWLLGGQQVVHLNGIGRPQWHV